MTLPRTEEHAYGEFSDDTTLVMQRRLPGPVARVWSYLTDSELRGQWLASGDMDQRPGSHFELVWRNDLLSRSPAERPAGFPEVSRATCQLTEVEPLRKLRFTWPDVGDVTITLQASGDDHVLLTLVHRGCAGRPMKTMLAAGWHTHLDILSARLRGTAAPSFWSTWQAFQREYEQRVSA